MLGIESYFYFSSGWFVKNQTGFVNLREICCCYGTIFMVAHAEVGALVEDLIRLGFFELHFFLLYIYFVTKKRVHG